MAGRETRRVLLFTAAASVALIGAACAGTPALHSVNSGSVQVRSAGSVGVQAPAPLQPSESDLGQARGQNAAPPTQGQPPPVLSPRQPVPPAQSQNPPADRCGTGAAVGPGRTRMPLPACMAS